MLRNGDWGNLALRCEEAQALKQRSHDPVDIGSREQPTKCSPFKRSNEDRKAIAAGLARYKTACGDMEGAKAISQQFGFVLDSVVPVAA